VHAELGARLRADSEGHAGFGGNRRLDRLAGPGQHRWNTTRGRWRHMVTPWEGTRRIRGVEVAQATMGVCAITALGVALPGGLFDIQPHPLWLLVLALSIRYGNPSGCVAGSLAARSVQLGRVALAASPESESRALALGADSAICSLRWGCAYRRGDLRCAREIDGGRAQV
jgi:hypothetical protein